MGVDKWWWEDLFCVDVCWWVVVVLLAVNVGVDIGGDGVGVGVGVGGAC